MSRKARIWIGLTIILVIAANYAIIGVPLMKKSVSIKEKVNTIFAKKIRSKDMSLNSEDEYLFEIFRKEKASVDTKINILNAVTLTLAIFGISWTAFGLFSGRERP